VYYIAYLFAQIVENVEVFYDLSLEPSGPEEQEITDNINNNPRLIEFACPRLTEIATLYIKELTRALANLECRN